MTSSKNQVTVFCRSPGKRVACAVERPLVSLQRMVGSVACESVTCSLYGGRRAVLRYAAGYNAVMSEERKRSDHEPAGAARTLTCGCAVTTSRDFLGRVVGTITVRAASCPREDHVAGRVVLMPGREHAAGD